MLTRIAIYQAINANQNPCSSDTIFKAVDPVSIFVCFLNANLASVSYGLRFSLLHIQNGSDDVATQALQNDICCYYFRIRLRIY